MKRLLVCAAIGGVMCVAAGAQMPKYGVTVNAEKNVDFAAFKTYSWTKGQPSAAKEIDAQIMAAVDRELSALGMTKAASPPGDVLAAYYSMTRTDVDLKAKANDGTRPQYSVGSLMVALLDPGSRRRLLRLRVDKPIDSDLANLGPAIDGAVAELFQHYPTRRQK